MKLSAQNSRIGLLEQLSQGARGELESGDCIVQGEIDRCSNTDLNGELDKDLMVQAPPSRQESTSQSQLIIGPG